MAFSLPTLVIGGALGGWLKGLLGGGSASGGYGSGGYSAPTAPTADAGAWEDAYNKNPEFLDNMEQYGI